MKTSKGPIIVDLDVGTSKEPMMNMWIMERKMCIQRINLRRMQNKKRYFLGWPSLQRRIQHRWIQTMLRTHFRIVEDVLSRGIGKLVEQDKLELVKRTQNF